MKIATKTFFSTKWKCNEPFFSRAFQLESSEKKGSLRFAKTLKKKGSWKFSFQNRMFCDPDSILKIGLAKLGVFDNFWIFRGHHGQFSVFFQCFFGDFRCFCLFLGVFDCFCVVFDWFLDEFYLRIPKQLKLQSSSSSQHIKLDIFGKFLCFLGVFGCFWVFLGVFLKKGRIFAKNHLPYRPTH